MFDAILTIIGMVVYATLLYVSPLAYAGIGCCYAEASGIINIGIEGMMSFGAFVGCAVAYFTANPFIAVLAAGIAGTILSIFHAYATIILHTDQTIMGTAINLIGPGIAVVISYALFNSTDTPPLLDSAKIPILFLDAFDLNTTIGFFFKSVLANYATTYILIFIVILSWFIFYKTKFGIRMRACGENPKACETLGIDVVKIRFICVMISGFLSGIGGACLTMAVTNQYRTIFVAGQGFIAMAAVIFGKHKPQGVLLGCLLFGFCQGLRVLIPKNIISTQLVTMIPYVIIILVLIFFGSETNSPKALGTPYYRGR